MKKPLMTVVTASYNSAKVIRATFDSILVQNFTDFEYLVIDGCSTDDTLLIVRSYSIKFRDKGIPFKWISEPDNGIYDAWNKGVNLANGSWISFLGSDDVYLENALEQYAEILCNPTYAKIDLVHSIVDVIDQSKVKKRIEGEWSWSRFRTYMNIAHVGAFHNNTYFERFGLFDTQYRIAGDYEMLLRAKSDLKTYKMNVLTVLMADGGISNAQVSKTFAETLRAKNITGGVSRFKCEWDRIIAILKSWVK